MDSICIPHERRKIIRLADKKLPYDLFLKLAVFPSLSLLALVVYLMTEDYESAWYILQEATSGQILVLASKVLFVTSFSAFVWRIILILFYYRPAKACSDEELPVCTVVVPAYNEGKQVLETVKSIALSDYPAEKLSIIAVDDGSTDDTWHWIQMAAREFPDRVLTRRQPVNRGKRQALREGFQHGRGDVYVTIDSDSLVEPQTIRRLVSPLVRDPRVGAVAGNVRVLNRNEGLIPRMLEVSFAYSFDFLRASQSAVNSVLCTPGALSAYRRDIVLNVLPQWLNQRFCGRLANIGEDRAMTNLVLKSGYHVHYQRDAMVFTNVPTKYTNLCRMFLRWARSNVRETIVMTRFAFGRFRETPAMGARINLLLGWRNMTVGQIMLIFAAVHFISMPMVFGMNLVIGALIASVTPGLFYLIRYRSGNAVWAAAYSCFWIFGLSWIGFYAILTPHKTRWLTRGLVKERETYEYPATNMITGGLGSAPAKSCGIRP
jgi:hyaluronan synthase